MRVDDAIRVALEKETTLLRTTNAMLKFRNKKVNETFGHRNPCRGKSQIKK